MKLMVDIPKEVYQAMKNSISLNSDQKGIAESAVYHGILSGTVLSECKSEDCDCISREAVMYYIKSHIHEIITESGTDKNAHTNAVLRALLDGVETMPGLCSDDLVNMMAEYIQLHDIKALMELVMKAINKVQGVK